MDNGLENMLDMYLFETNTLIEQLDEILLSAEKSETFSQENINEIFRIMHTIKGSSAMMQFDPVMQVAHHVEDLFYCIREHGIDAGHKDRLFDLMFKSNDFLKIQVDKIQNGDPLNDNIGDLVDEINAFLRRVHPDTRDAAQAEESAPSNAFKEPDISEEDDGEFSLTLFFDEGVGMENLRAFMLVSSLSDVIGTFEFSPADVETNPATSNEIVQNGFKIKLNGRGDLERAVSVIRGALNIKTYEVFEPQAELPHVDEPVQKKENDSVVEKKPQPAVPAQSAAAPAKQSLISVNLTKLDKLMDLVGEIVITESMVTTSSDLRGIKLDNFTKSARQLRKLTDELQNIVMSIRMVPVAGVFQRMNRIVRDIGQSLQKSVRLNIVGENTEVDKAIVDSISDPIMHTVRNAMDHGIEDSAEARLAAGKPAEGEILLKAEHTGSEVLITIRDDGRGVNYERVLEKAREGGLLVKPEEEYTKKETIDLLMMPGFSTKKEANEYSGRGVGMDVVKQNIEKIGGTVSITSEPGNGMQVVFKIPLTLAIMDGMDISVGNSIFTIPITHIRQSFKIQKSDVVHDADRGEMIRRMDQFYPIIRLKELYGFSEGKEDISEGILLWLESSDNSFCLFVDELLGEQQIVIKPLPSYLKDYNVKEFGIAGCAILGDGSISIILDVHNLYSAFIGR